MSRMPKSSVLEKLTVASILKAPVGLPYSQIIREKRRTRRPARKTTLDPLAAERKELSQYNALEISKRLQTAVTEIASVDPAALIEFKKRVGNSKLERCKQLTITQALVEALEQGPAMTYHLRLMRELSKLKVLNGPPVKATRESTLVANQMLASISEIRVTNAPLLTEFKIAQEKDCPRGEGLRICLLAVIWSYARGKFLDTAQMV